MDQRLVHFPDLADRVWASLNLNQHQLDLPVLGVDRSRGAHFRIWDRNVFFEEFRTTNLIHCDFSLPYCPVLPCFQDDKVLLATDCGFLGLAILYVFASSQKMSR